MITATCAYVLLIGDIEEFQQHDTMCGLVESQQRERVKMYVAHYWILIELQQRLFVWYPSGIL